MNPGQHPAPPENIDRALFTLARLGDNAEAAAQELDMNPRTLRHWRQTHRDRYDELRTTHVHEIEQGLVHEYRQNAILSASLHRTATLKALEQAEAGELKDPARVAREASIAAGVATDKLLVLTDRPNVITERRDVEADLALLARRAGIVAVHDAEEITDADNADQTLLAEIVHPNPREDATS